MKTFYQDASAVEQKVKDLQERVTHLMIGILRHVTPKSEKGNEAVVKVVKGIEEDIKQLLWCAPTNVLQEVADGLIVLSRQSGKS